MRAYKKPPFKLGKIGDKKEAKINARGESKMKATLTVVWIRHNFGEKK